MMKNILRYIVHEPYMHFLILGSLLFFYYQSSPKNLSSKQQKIITITQAQKEELSSTLKQKLNREPSSAELQFLVDEFFENEMLIEEAINLGLEKQDSQMRNKLIGKMKLILQPTLEEPTEEELQRFYQAHQEEYSKALKVTFWHIYFKDATNINLENFSNYLNMKHILPNNAPHYGEHFLGGNFIESISFEDAIIRFGNYFATHLWRLPSKSWQGILRSKEGYHFVYITDKEYSQLLPFDEVQDRVYDDLQQLKKIKALQSNYSKLLTQYEMDSK